MRALLLGSALVFLPATVYAAPQIAAGSELSINGEDTFTPTTVTFVGEGNVEGTAGSFTALTNCFTCVAFSQSLSASSTGLLYTVTDAGLSSTFSISKVTNVTPGGTPTLPSLEIGATGTLTLSGFAPTTGEFELTTQGPEGSIDVTFSGTSVPVPEPSSAAVLGMGVLGLLGFTTLSMRRIRR